MKPTPSSLFSARQLVPYLLVLASLIPGTSCKKGDTGPAGPQGQQGPPGQTGAQGPAGTANVFYSPWFASQTYTRDTLFGAYGYYYDKSAPAITRSILDSGTVITFGRLTGYDSHVWPDSQVAALPITITYVLGGQYYTDTWSAFAKPGNLRIKLVTNFDFGAVGINTSTYQFRYVVIPGGFKLTSSTRPGFVNGEGNAFTNGSLDYTKMSYDEICHALGIPK